MSVPSPQYLSDSSRTDRIGTKPDRRDNAKQNEKRQHNELSELKRRLGLRWSDYFQRRYFFERLHDPDEHIKIERDHGGDHVDPPPGAGEVTRVTRINGDREHQQRYDANANRWRETMERKKEARHARQHGSNQEPLGPTVEAFASEHAKQNDQAGKNSDQADQHVNYCVYVQYHGLPITFFSASNVTSRLRDSRTCSLFLFPLLMMSRSPDKLRRLVSFMDSDR